MRAWRWIACLAIASGCRDRGDAAPVASVVDELPKQEQLVVLAHGTEPRLALRYRPSPERAIHHAATTLAARQLVDGALSEPLALPTVRDGLAIDPGATPGRIELRVLAPELGPAASDRAREAGAQYAAGWDAARDRRAIVELDARGQLGGIELVDDPGAARSRAARDELAQRLLATIVPLPEEPVGEQASWRVTTILRQHGASLKQTATYTLVERARDAWTLRVAILRVAEEQRVDDPALSAGATLDLVALFRKLDGEVVVDPRRLLVERGSLAIESRVHVRAALPGREPAEQLFEDTGSVRFTIE